MNPTESFSDFKEWRKDKEKKLSDFIFAQLKEKGFSDNELRKKIKTDFNVDLNSGTISGYKNGNASMPFPVICVASEILGYSGIDELLREAEIYKKSVKDTCNSKLSINLENSSSLIIEPSAKIFKGYIVSFYIYFPSTISQEKELITGTLSFEKNENRVLAKLKIKLGKNKHKEYKGTLVASSSVNAFYCILSSKEIGEMSFLCFEHFPIKTGRLECCIAQALTCAAGAQTYPTVHRMFISSQKIKKEDFLPIKLCLNLNNSNIIIKDRDLEKIANENTKYKEIIENICGSNEAEEYHLVYETIALKTAERNIGDESEALEFIKTIREHSVDLRNNKSSTKANENINKYLKKLGYYKKGKKM